MIVKTDAVVLRSMRFRETSKIVTFYTRRYGKLAAVAKGAREPRSKFGASLEPMTGVSLVLYKKDQRDLQLVSQCDIRTRHKRIHSEMDRMGAALSVVELINQVTHDEEESPSLFSLLDETLDAIESAEGNVSNYRPAFELRLCGIFGFAPVFDKCVVCGKASPQAAGSTSVVFQLDKGGLVCPSCVSKISPGTKVSEEHEESFVGNGPSYRKLRVATGLVMERLFTASLHSLAGLQFPVFVGNELDATLRSYLRYHFENIRPLRSASIFERIAE